MPNCRDGPAARESDLAAQAIRLLLVPGDPRAGFAAFDGPDALPPQAALPEAGIIGLVWGDAAAEARRLRRLGAGMPGLIATAGARELLLRRGDLAFEPLGLTADGPGAPAEALWRLHPPAGATALARPRPPASGCDIGVLPFRAPVGETRLQERAWGLSDDIRARLTRFRDLRVLGRGTAWAWRHSGLAAAEIGRLLGLRLVVEGALRQSDGLIRLDVALIEVATGRAVWAERLLRAPRGFHGLAEALTARVVAALGGRLAGHPGGGPGMVPPPLADPRAAELVQRGRARLAAGGAEGLAEAEALAAAALDLAPGAGCALRFSAECGLARLRLGLARDADLVRARAEADAAAAARADPQDARAFALLGELALTGGDHDAAAQAWQTAVALNPADAGLLAAAAAARMHLGEPEEALALISRAMELEPWYPDDWLATLGAIYLAARRPEEALRAFLRMQDPGPARPLLTAALVWAGREAEAAREAARLLAAEPGFTIRAWLAGRPDRDPAQGDRLAEGLRAAGLPWA